MLMEYLLTLFFCVLFIFKRVMDLDHRQMH